MIRILDSKTRKPEDYEMLSDVLTEGLNHFLYQ